MISMVGLDLDVQMVAAHETCVRGLSLTHAQTCVLPGSGGFHVEYCDSVLRIQMYRQVEHSTADWLVGQQASQKSVAQ
jgi:hypothetical protein